MAIAIGGFRGYEGHQGFDFESYAKGTLDHQIGDREVFTKDPMDDLEYEVAFWNTVKAAKANGIPIEMILKDHGWSEEKINQVVNSVENRARIASLNQITMMDAGSTEANSNTTENTGGMLDGQGTITQSNG